MEHSQCNTPSTKWILHIDFDSFFASVEQQANPKYRDKPLGVVGGVGSTVVESATIVASSKEAKKLGIKTGWRAFEARKKCPEIILVNPRFSKYTSIHKKWHEIVKEFSPIIEVFSVDEAFLDISHWVSVWGYAPDKVGEMVKSEVQKQLGDVITSSVGIAQNKIMAKLATGFGKPDGLTVLQPKDHEKALKSIAPTKICGIGHRLSRRLRAGIGGHKITTAWDIGQVPEHLLRRHFGIYGKTLHEMGRGIYNAEIITEEKFPKSIGHSKVLARLTDGDEVFFVMRQLCEMVAYRARKYRAKGNVIHAAASHESPVGGMPTHRSRFGKRAKIDDHTSDGHKIFKEAKSLVGHQLEIGTRFVAVTLAGIVHEKAYTFSFLNNEVRLEKAFSAMDKIKDKYGSRSIGLASQA